MPATAVQYVLHRDGEKLYGRGVYDMKFAVACYLQLLQALKDQLAELDFAIMLSSDEEIGGSHGVEPLLREGYTAEVCIIPDGGDNWCIEKSSKGGWVVELSAPGRSAHSSRPWEGDNAAEKLLKTLRPILALNTNDQDGVTVILTQLNGGKAINQVPSSASATVDVRFDNLDSYHEVRAAILKLAKQDGCRVKELLSIDSVHTNLEGVHAKSFREITADVLVKTPTRLVLARPPARVTAGFLQPTTSRSSFAGQSEVVSTAIASGWMLSPSTTTTKFCDSSS